MMESDEYRTIKASSSGIFKDRGSKFIAHAYRVGSAEEAKGIIEEVKKDYRDARHHCYAYKIGTEDDNWRVNDDGEPSGTAGRPILGQISSFELSNVLIVVVRYFGGTLLGVGGLINAYRNAARNALENSIIITEHLKVKVHISFPYEAMNAVMKIIKDENPEQSNQVFENSCSLDLCFRKSDKDRLIGRLSIIEGITINDLPSLD